MLVLTCVLPVQMLLIWGLILCEIHKGKSSSDMCISYPHGVSLYPGGIPALLWSQGSVRIV